VILVARPKRKDVVPGRREAANPESTITVGVHGFRRSLGSAGTTAEDET